jgi:hypothetical protein
MSDANQSSSSTTPLGGGATGTTVVPGTPSKTPGWYPAPDDDSSEIYWDGDRFNGNRKKDPPSLASRWDRFKKGFSREKWIAGAVVAFLPTIGIYIGHLMSQHSAAEQAQRTFAQTQERDAYIGFYNSVDQFVEDIWAEIRLWEPNEGAATFRRLAEPMKENLGTGMNNVLNAESKVTFYGSQETQKAANDVVEQVGDIQSLLAHYEVANPQYPHLSDVQASEFGKTVLQIREIIRAKLQSAHLAFRRAARVDLGLPHADDDIYNPLYDPSPRGAQPAVPAPPARAPIFGSPQMLPPR